jgi:hypothetical protein
MTRATSGEAAFEQFCEQWRLGYERVQECDTPTPDYLLDLGYVRAAVEIKQIDEDVDFAPPISSRTVGDHVRAKINEARKQLRGATERATPAILLVYNNLDPLQRFGTEQHDFVAAMYGESTVSVSVNTGAVLGSLEGRNKSFRPGKNDSFSAIGSIRRTANGLEVHLYENLYAKVPLDYARLPECMRHTRFELDSDSDA